MRLVLQIRVLDQDIVASRFANTALHSFSLALIGNLRKAMHLRKAVSPLARDFFGVVARAIVDDDQFLLKTQSFHRHRQNPLNQRSNKSAFVVSRDDDGKNRHGPRRYSFIRNRSSAKRARRPSDARIFLPAERGRGL